MEQGWDPRVKKFFQKILNSLAWGLLWMMSCILGIYKGLASSDGNPLIYTLLFYAVMTITLGLLIRYFYKTWKNG